MQRPSKKQGQSRPKNTGHIDVTEYNYIKHLLAKSGESQASVSRLVKRSSASMSYIARSKSYEDYCQSRDKAKHRDPKVTVAKTESGKSVTANSSQVDLFPTPIAPPGKKLKIEDGKFVVVPETEKPSEPKSRTDYSGALLGQTARLTSAINELNMTLVSIRPILAKAVDERDFERPVESSDPQWYHMAIICIVSVAFLIGYLYLIGYFPIK